MAGRHLTPSEWTTVLLWCDENLKDTNAKQPAIKHFALPENGGFIIQRKTLRKRQAEWEEAKRTGQEPVFKLRGANPATLSDSEWLRAFQFMDKHPTYSHARVAQHFEQEEGLKFNRGQYAAKLMQRKEIERRVREAEAAKGKGKSQPERNERPLRRTESAEESSLPTPSAGPSRQITFKLVTASTPKNSGNKNIADTPSENPRQRVTDRQWLEVFKFVDEHPLWTKDNISLHFARQGIGFHRSTMTNKLRERDAIERRVLESSDTEGQQEATEGPSSPNKPEAKPPKPVVFSTQRWSSRLAKEPLNHAHTAVEPEFATAFPDEGGDNTGDGMGEKDGEPTGEIGHLIDSDDEYLTPLPDTPPRPRSSPTPITVPPLSPTTPLSLQPLPSVDSDNTGLPDHAPREGTPPTTDDPISQTSALEQQSPAFSAPPRFKRKKLPPASPISPYLPKEKRARLSSTECDSEATPSLSISSLPTVSDSSASMRSTPMSPSEPHSDLPDPAHASCIDVEVEPLDLLETFQSPGAAAPVLARDPHTKESLSLRSRLWDAWLP